MNNRLIQCINGVCTRLGSTPETPQYIAIANDREQKKNENEEK